MSTSVVNSPVELYDWAKVVGAKALHQKGITGKGITVGVIDTGCAQHQLLQGVIKYANNFNGQFDVGDYSDSMGHGTHVAGIIAARPDEQFVGMAPGANLVIAKVDTPTGTCTIEALVNAIDYMIDQKVDIINMSVCYEEDSWALRRYVTRAIQEGIVVVAASGNDGDGDPLTTEKWYPGGYQNVIEVGAVDNYETPAGFTNSNVFVDLCAPGVEIVSLYNESEFATRSGTSMATPIVSGAMALLKEWFRNEFQREPSVEELYGTLIKCTRNLKHPRTQQGFGMLDLNLLYT